MVSIICIFFFIFRPITKIYNIINAAYLYSNNVWVCLIIWVNNKKFLLLIFYLFGLDNKIAGRMVSGALEHGMQADVVFIIESTASNGAYLNEFKTNYIIPTLEYFSQGGIEDREFASEVINLLNN